MIGASPRVRRRLVLSLLLGSGRRWQQAQLTAQAQAAPSKFRSSVDVVSVSAVVRDRKGRFVRDLGAEGLHRRGGRAAATILDFRAESDGPVKLALLFDVSGSMRVGTKAVDARQAAPAHPRGARGRATKRRFSASTRGSTACTPFTSDAAALEASLEHVSRRSARPRCTTRWRRPRARSPTHGPGGGRLPQRSAVVVLTDGIDTRSRLTSEQVAAIAEQHRRAGLHRRGDGDRSTIHARTGRPRRDVAGRCQTLARWTGGSCSWRARRRTRASRRVRSSTSCATSTCSPSRRRSRLAGGRWRCGRAIADLTVRARAGYTARSSGGSERRWVRPEWLGDGARRQGSASTHSVGHLGRRTKMKKLVSGRTGSRAGAWRHDGVRDQEDGAGRKSGK